MTNIKLYHAAAISAVLISCIFASCSPERNLKTVLEDAASAGVPLFGHQDDLMYGHDWNANPDDFSLTRSDVLATAGAYPFVLGLDLGSLELDGAANIDGNDFALMREAAVKHHERGGIVTFSWHMRNPLTGGDTWDVSNDSTVVSVLPGGCCHEKFIGWMDRVCDYLSSLRDSEGRVVPVIWRPFHEHTGDWFWWCSSECTAEQYNALWRMMHDYMMDVRGMKGLLWEISPSAYQLELFSARYPGDEYVDIIGLDSYCQTGLPADGAVADYLATVRRSFDFLSSFASEHDKLLAFAETGYEGIPSSSWWTGALAPAIEGYPLSYVLVWRNATDEEHRDWHYFCPWPGEASVDDFADWTASGAVRMLK